MGDRGFPSFESNSCAPGRVRQGRHRCYAGAELPSAQPTFETDGGKACNDLRAAAPSTTSTCSSPRRRACRARSDRGSFSSLYQRRAHFHGAINNFGTPPQDAGLIPGIQRSLPLSQARKPARGKLRRRLCDGAKYTTISIPDSAADSSKGFLARYGASSEKTWYVTTGSFGNGISAQSRGTKMSSSINSHLRRVVVDTVVQINKQNPSATSDDVNVSLLSNYRWWSYMVSRVQERQNYREPTYPNGIHCISEDNCAVLEGDSAIIVTRDGGKTWNETMTDMDPHVAVCCAHAFRRRSMGRGGHPSGQFEQVWHSLDGGNT